MSSNSNPAPKKRSGGRRTTGSFVKGDPKVKEWGARGGRARAAARRKITKPYAGTVLDMMDDAGLTGPTWEPWRTIMRAVFGLGLPSAGSHLARFHQHTERQKPPKTGAAVDEAWIVAGRRAGKSRIAALAALFCAIRFDATHLAAGELPVIPLLAADRRQARIVMSYLRALCQLPSFHPYVHRVMRETIELHTSVNVEVATASFRTIRGYTVPAAVLDEIAFWRDESSSNPDSEILDALRPCMATIPGSLLFAISSPYGRRGELYATYERYYGQDDPHVLVWNGSTQSLNPTVPDRVIERAFDEDALSAAAEYGSGGKVSFRRDVESYIDIEALAAVTVPDRRELPPVAATRYTAFVDPSGGSKDSFTVAIAHREGDDRAVLDVVKETRPPFSPAAVVKNYAELVQSYGMFEVTGDRYAGQWPREAFQKHGVTYVTSARVKSDIYREICAPINSARVELLDLPVLRAQFLGLERRTARGGKDSIDHAPGGRDDVANAVAGVLVAVLPTVGGKKKVLWV